MKIWRPKISSTIIPTALQWQNNGRDSVSNQQPHDCLHNRLFRRRSKKTSKLRVTGLCEGNSPMTGEFPAQMASNAENVSIWWRHHDVSDKLRILDYRHGTGFKMAVVRHAPLKLILFSKEISFVIFSFNYEFRHDSIYCKSHASLQQ